MRLIYIEEKIGVQEYYLQEFTNDVDIPCYAILSHVWEQADQEVSYQDLFTGPVPQWGRPVGRDKLRFCAARIKKDGLRYFWIDTCCIDKSNSTELSEALNSMYRWYQNAAKCYVYLRDFQYTRNSSNDWKQRLIDHRWFTRGWTLQELIAPRVVEFYAQDWTYLGDKISLEYELEKTTGIPSMILRGAPVELYRVDDRLKWAQGRSTTRPEDKAYCLLGIMGVFMPVLYGVGENVATRELQRKIDESRPSDMLQAGNIPIGLGTPRKVTLGSASWLDLAHLTDAQLKELDDGLEREAYWINNKMSQNNFYFSSDFTIQMLRRLKKLLADLGVDCSIAGTVVQRKELRRKQPCPGVSRVIGANGGSFRWPPQKRALSNEETSYSQGIVVLKTIRSLMVWRGIWIEE